MLHSESIQKSDESDNQTLQGSDENQKNVEPCSRTLGLFIVKI